ncbi:long tail fiber protein distal subunit [Escherichia phage WG01]|uniref:Long tail fiber protein Gp37 n=1 Tax=Escherichia phage WG01 TaxID=1837931 RepID=A0A172Q1K1_9CAUD|nr:long tail fiber protein distal subunit [Escherichia phage WG01]AND75922.1 long tail fiber distal subunit [Escherichia phage WG01]
MATLKQIQFKRSKVAGVRPAPAQLAEGELAINLKDRLLFTKDDTGAIIDLGFAKGGNIDGNVIHKGNYNQTGDYTLNGVFTQIGDFNLNGIARVTRDIIAAGQIMTEGGELISKSASTSHLRFFDGDDRERGIIFSPNNAGLTNQVVNIRVQDYAAGSESTYAFSGNGVFSSPEVFGWKSVSTPVIYTNKVITNKKVKGDYDIYSLADNTPFEEGETAINHLRVMRNAVGAGIFHEVNVNDGITWYSGDGLDTYLWSFNWAGGLKAGHSISVGLPGGSKGYSELGTASIALGDNDTGLKWHQDGYFFSVNNGTRTFLSGPAETTSLRKMVMGYSVNGTDLTTPPSENYALATVVTYHDNNAYGDGQTLLGYYQGGNYHHYFRGKGTTNVNTAGGLLVTPGNIDVVGGSVNIDGRNNASTLMFRGNTTGSSSVDNMTIAVWGNTFTNVDGDRKNVMEISDATSWMWYIQRKTDDKVEAHLNGALRVNGSIDVGREVNVSGTIAGNAVNALRIWNDDYGAIFRRSEGSLHIIPTAFGEGKTGDIGPLRPFSLALDTGKVVIPDLDLSHTTFAENGFIKFGGHGAGAGGYDIQYAQAAPIFQEIDDDAVSKYYPIVKQKFLQGKAVWSLGTEINSGTFVLHHYKEDGTQGHTSRFNADGTVNFPDNVQVGGGEATIARNGNIFSDIWNGFNGAGNITNIRDAIATRVSKEGDTMTGRLTLKTNSDAVVIDYPADEAGYVKGKKGGVDNWYVGNGGADNGLAFWSFQSQGGININPNGEVILSPQGTSIFSINRDRIYMNGAHWVARKSGAWGDQWGLEAPYFLEFGSVGEDSYYPIIKGRSVISGQGYTTSVELGMRRTPQQWGQAIIRVGNAERGDGPVGIFEFHSSGRFYSPSSVQTPSISVNTDNGLGASSIAIGDNDTGLVHGGDGRINMYANSMHIASWGAGYHIHEGLWDTTGALWTETGRAIISFGHLVQQNDSYSTFVRDVYVRSDIRVKKDLVKFENASQTLSKINGYTYMQKRGLDEEGNQKWEPNAGLIAQEVQAILPELVEGDPDGEALLRLNYNGVIGLNTAAINEHTAEIAELKSEIEELKALIKSLLK